METIVKLESISAGYGDEVILKDINLAVEEQDFIGVIGPNGGGKSTLVKVITGLIKPMAGKVIFHKGHDTPGNRCLIGYLPQFNQFDKKFPISVLDVVLSGIADGRKPFKRFSKNEIRQAIINPTLSPSNSLKPTIARYKLSPMAKCHTPS